MSSAEKTPMQSTSIARHVRTGQIITFAMVQGMILLTAILVIMQFSEPAADPANDAREPAGWGQYVLPGIVVVWTVTALIASFIVPSMIRNAALNRFHGDPDAPSSVPPPDETLPEPLARLLGADQVARIVTQAIYEGLGTVSAIFLLIDDQLGYLAASAIAVAGIASQFPSKTQIQHWLETALQNQRS